MNLVNPISEQGQNKAERKGSKIVNDADKKEAVISWESNSFPKEHVGVIGDSCKHTGLIVISQWVVYVKNEGICEEWCITNATVWVQCHFIWTGNRIGDSSKDTDADEQ